MNSHEIHMNSHDIRMICMDHIEMHRHLHLNVKFQVHISLIVLDIKITIYCFTLPHAHTEGHFRNGTQDITKCENPSLNRSIKKLLKQHFCDYRIFFLNPKSHYFCIF